MRFVGANNPLMGPESIFMLHCFISSFHNVNSPEHIWSTYVALTFSHSIKNTNETTLKHVDVTLELMKEHCFVPPQAVRHQCHDEVLHSHCCSAPVVFHLQLAPTSGAVWTPVCRFGGRALKKRKKHFFHNRS